MADGERDGGRGPLGSKVFRVGALALSIGCLGVLMAVGQGALGCGNAPEPSARPDSVALPPPPAGAEAAPTTGASTAAPVAAGATGPAPTGEPSAASALDVEEGEYFPASKAGPPFRRRPKPTPEQAQQPAPQAPNAPSLP
jgi:DNA polymerase-3 subunit gamma/tau